MFNQDAKILIGWMFILLTLLFLILVVTKVQPAHAYVYQEEPITFTKTFDFNSSEQGFEQCARSAGELEYGGSYGTDNSGGWRAYVGVLPSRPPTSFREDGCVQWTGTYEELGIYPGSIIHSALGDETSIDFKVEVDGSSYNYGEAGPINLITTSTIELIEEFKSTKDKDWTTLTDSTETLGHNSDDEVTLQLKTYVYAWSDRNGWVAVHLDNAIFAFSITEPVRPFASWMLPTALAVTECTFITTSVTTTATCTDPFIQNKTLDLYHGIILMLLAVAGTILFLEMRSKKIKG